MDCRAPRLWRTVAVATAALTGIVGTPAAAAAAAATSSVVAAPPPASAPVTPLPPATSGTSVPTSPTSSTLPPASSGGAAPPQTVPIPATTTTIPATTATTMPAGPPGSTTTTIPVRNIELDAASPEQLAGLNSDLRRAREDLGAAQAEQRRAQLNLQDVTAKVVAAQARLVSLAAQERAAVEGLQVTHNHLRDLAVSNYVSGGSLTAINALLNATSINDFVRRKSFIAVLDRAGGQVLRRYRDARSRASTAAKKTFDALARSQSAQQVADQQVAAAGLLVVQRTAVVADRAQLAELVAFAVGSPGTDIPSIVLDAYRKAAATVQKEGCRLPWWGLAGIGRVESGHGRAQHAHLTATGDLVPPIIGLPLNGQDGTALILASDKGRYTGDPIYEHAVGPMQFLPSTWATIGRDGNGDGIADPNNVFDAALGAASYLCRAGAGTAMDTDAGLRQAYFSYNHSTGYVEEVLAFAHAYAAVDVTAAP